METSDLQERSKKKASTKPPKERKTDKFGFELFSDDESEGDVCIKRGSRKKPKPKTGKKIREK